MSGDAETRQLQRLVKASLALHTTLDLDKLLGVILEQAQEGVDADRGTVFLLTEDGRELWSRVHTGDGDLDIRLPVGQGIAGSVAATGETVCLRDAHEDPRFDASWDRRSGYRTRQLLTAPIRSREGRVVGVFQLLNKRTGDFDAQDEAFLEDLSVHVALAVENARLHRSALEKQRQDREIELVQAVQRAYQPERMAVERALAQGGRLAAAGMNVLCEDASGDYYDFIDLPGDRLAVALGDVSGHGLHAAMVMAQARAMLRAFSDATADPSRLMGLLNAALARDMQGGRFMTLFLGVADLGDGRLAWASAGHPPALLWRAATGAVEALEASGPVTGVLAAATYPPQGPVLLGPGDLLLVYTDGVTEAADPEGRFFEEEGLRRTLAGSAERGPAAVLDAVRDAVVQWTGHQAFRDDLTLLALCRMPDAGGGAAVGLGPKRLQGPADVSRAS